MTRIDAAQQRAAGRDLAGVLDAAYEAFDAMLSVLHPAQDPASDLFTAFMMAGVLGLRRRRSGRLPSRYPKRQGHLRAAHQHAMTARTR
jgi:hypothetical protein